IYPLGLPNGLAHTITGLAVFLKLLFGMKSRHLPPDPKPVAFTVRNQKQATSGRFSLMAVTTLEKLLLSGELGGERRGALKLIAVDEKLSAVVRAFFAALVGTLGRSHVRGVHFEETDEITIEGDSSRMILDGETFSAETGRPIRLSPANPLSFVKLAA
ncbi:MAG: diacylglycerol kinase, partial [Sphingomicrobium sp.]